MQLEFYFHVNLLLSWRPTDSEIPSSLKISFTAEDFWLSLSDLYLFDYKDRIVDTFVPFWWFQKSSKKSISIALSRFCNLANFNRKKSFSFVWNSDFRLMLTFIALDCSVLALAFKRLLLTLVSAKMLLRKIRKPLWGLVMRLLVKKHCSARRIFYFLKFIFNLTPTKNKYVMPLFKIQRNMKFFYSSVHI